MHTLFVAPTRNGVGLSSTALGLARALATTIVSTSATRSSMRVIRSECRADFRK